MPALLWAVSGGCIVTIKFYVNSQQWVVLCYRPMLGAHIVFLHSGFGGFGSSRSAPFYDLQPPFAWLFSTSISFLEKLEDSLVLNAVFNCDPTAVSVAALRKTAFFVTIHLFIAWSLPFLAKLMRPGESAVSSGLSQFKTLLNHVKFRVFSGC